MHHKGMPRILLHLPKDTPKKLISSNRNIVNTAEQFKAPAKTAKDFSGWVSGNTAHLSKEGPQKQVSSDHCITNDAEQLEDTAKDFQEMVGATTAPDHEGLSLFQLHFPEDRPQKPISSNHDRPIANTTTQLEAATQIAKDFQMCVSVESATCHGKLGKLLPHFLKKRLQEQVSSNNNAVNTAKQWEPAAKTAEAFNGWVSEKTTADCKEQDEPQPSLNKGGLQQENIFTNTIINGTKYFVTARRTVRDFDGRYKLQPLHKKRSPIKSSSCVVKSMVVHSGKGHKCKVCSKTLTTPCALSRHMRFAHSFGGVKLKITAKRKTLQEWKCKDCAINFKTKLELQNHRVVHVKERKKKEYKCKLCEVVFEKKAELICHRSVHHHKQSESNEHGKSRKKEFNCLRCKISFEQMCEWSLHRNTVHKWECTECSLTFDSRSKMTAHRRSYHANKLFTCNDCSAAYVEKRFLLKHQKNEHSFGEFTCKYCDKPYVTRYELKLHIPTHRVFLCKVCPANFVHRTHLARHSLVHSENKYSCEECSAMFVRKDDLNGHMRTHTLERPFKCPDCKQNFARKAHLKTHMLTHNLKKPFKCSECTAAFRQKGGLTAHTRRHVTETKFQCNECESTFIRKGDLKRHMDLHLGKKPFNCPECSYSCARKSNLNIHIRIHTGVKPYKCKTCKHACTNKSDLMKHIKVVHAKVKSGDDNENKVCETMQ